MQLSNRSLSEIIETVETTQRTIRVRNFTGDPADREAIVAFFDSYEVDVEIERLADRPTDVVDLFAGDVRVASSPVEAVVEYVEAWEESLTTGLRIELPAVLERLTNNHFESYRKKQMILGSRIVEFRAWNRGTGTLHAGFQQLSKLDRQRVVYRNLASSDVTVHVYGASDRTPADLDVAVHPGTDDEVLRHWWVAYDGAGVDEDKIVLLAQERGPNVFYGFWTEQPRVVDDVLDRMAAIG